MFDKQWIRIKKSATGRYVSANKPRWVCSVIVSWINFLNVKDKNRFDARVFSFKLKTFESLNTENWKFSVFLAFWEEKNLNLVSENDINVMDDKNNGLQNKYIFLRYNLK